MQGSPTRRADGDLPLNPHARSASPADEEASRDDGPQLDECLKSVNQGRTGDHNV